MFGISDDPYQTCRWSCWAAMASCINARGSFSSAAESVSNPALTLLPCGFFYRFSFFGSHYYFQIFTVISANYVQSVVLETVVPGSLEWMDPERNLLRTVRQTWPRFGWVDGKILSRQKVMASPQFSDYNSSLCIRGVSELIVKVPLFHFGRREINILDRRITQAFHGSW